MLPIYSKDFVIPDTTSVNIFQPGNQINGTQWRFSITGAGTAEIQPIYDGGASHKSYLVTQDSVSLDLSQVQDFKITASGGDVNAVVTGLN